MSKKVKVKGLLRLEETFVSGCSLGYFETKYKYALEGFDETPPDEIEFSIKRKPKTISEFIEVNELTEEKALEILKNNL